jgi:glycosyltransferase involved in cell wall biosynthesis
MAKEVLIVSYFFPPLGMGGVQRMSKLAKYLPAFGYKPVILTVKPVSYPACDQSLLAELPDDLPVYRSGSYDPSRFAYLLKTKLPQGDMVRQKARARLKVWPDTKIGWKGPAVRKGRKIIESHKPCAIVSSSPPMTAHMVAMKLAEEYSIPWIADFRDFWEPQPPDQLFEDPALRDKSLQLLNNIADEATRITTVVDDITRRYPSRSETIMGGFDPEDFYRISPPESSLLCRLGYMGTVSDLAPIELFFDAARRAANRDAVLLKNLRFRFIGHADSSYLEKKARKYGFGDRLELYGYLDHREALRRAAECTMSIISVKRSDAHIITSKVFDCLALPQPILAAAPPESALDRLIKYCNAGYCVDPNDISYMAERIAELHKRSSVGEKWEKINLDEFSRQAIAGRFAAILDKITNA